MLHQRDTDIVVPRLWSLDGLHALSRRVELVQVSGPFRRRGLKKTAQSAEGTR